MDTPKQARHREVRRVGRSTYLLGPEDAIQFDYFHWVDTHKGRFPQLKRIFAVPNGAAKSKTQRAVMQVTGLRPGVPDVWCLGRGGHPELPLGLVIEFKSKTGRMTPEQNAWFELLRAVGYRCEIHRSWITAANATIDHYRLPLEPLPE